MSPQQKPADADSAASARTHLQSVNIRCLGCPRFTQDSWEREIIVPMTSLSSYRAGWGRNAAQYVGEERSREPVRVLVCSGNAEPICRGRSLGQQCQQVPWR